MQINETKAVLSASAQAEVEKALQAQQDFLKPEAMRINVRGMGVGVKWKNGQPTGEPALVVLVSQKLERNMLSRADLIPAKLGDMQTDVLAVGEVFAGNAEEVGVQTLTRRVRPAEGGYSVGHFKITAGTMATAVYDLLPGATVSPPAHGLGIPPRFYILSNNHVLANSNDANLGDPILQPGVFDGGTLPADLIARLSRFVPITFEPPVPRAQHRNLVDAAIAEGQFHDLDREIYWNGYVQGWQPRARTSVGQRVKKTGRTTNMTTGRVTVVGATIDVNFGGGRVARFIDQIVTTNMSAPGDSGSLISSERGNLAVGLLFAGSSLATIANHFEHVRSLLRIEVAEGIG